MLFTPLEEKKEKIQFNKIEKCSHENKIIICTYSFCEVKGLCCFDCFKKNHVSHIQDCYDKNLINITKENQTQREERKKIFSKIIENFIEKLDGIKKLIDKKIEYLKNLNNIEINDVVDIEKYEVFQIIKKCNLFQKNELDYSKLNEIFFNYYINSLFEIKNFNQSIVDNLIIDIICPKNKIFINKFDKEHLYDNLEKFNDDNHEINFLSKKDFVLTDIGVYGFTEEIFSLFNNNQNFSDDEKKINFDNNSNNLFNLNIFDNNNNVFNNKDDFIKIESIYNYNKNNNNSLFGNNIKINVNEINCIIEKNNNDNNTLFNNNILNQSFDKYVFNKMKFHNIKLNNNIKIEKNQSYKIIFKNIKNCNAMKTNERYNENKLTILKYLTFKEN